MAFFKEVAQKDIDKLPLIVKELFDGLNPILGQINPVSLDLDKSYLEVQGTDNGHKLVITIQAKEKSVPPLYLVASEENFLLWMLDPHESDHEGKPKPDSASIAYVINKIQRYLQGITVVLHYDSKNRIIKKVYYYGLDSGELDENRFGATELSPSFIPLFLRPKTETTRKISYSFLNK